MNGWERFLKSRERSTEMSDNKWSDEVGEGPAFDRELPKQGSCGARVWKSFNVGMQPFKGGSPSPKILVYFILPYKYSDGEYKGKRMLIWQKYTAGFGKKGGKSYLRRDMQMILNREIEDKEIPFSLTQVWGAPCMIQIVHENGYANIKAVMSLPEGMPPLVKDETADPDSSYVPAYVTKLREASVVQEHADTDKVAEAGWKAAGPAETKKPTEKEAEIF